MTSDNNKFNPARLFGTIALDVGREAGLFAQPSAPPIVPPQNTPAAKPMNYTPWIIGAAAVLLLVMLSKK